MDSMLVEARRRSGHLCATFSLTLDVLGEELVLRAKLNILLAQCLHPGLQLREPLQELLGQVRHRLDSAPTGLSTSKVIAGRYCTMLVL